MPRPNILVVLADQMRRHATGHMGDPNVRTPALDRMAREGVVFTAACSSYPVCVPFRFTLLTGEYAHSRDVPSLGFRMSPAERTLGEAVTAAGYDTAYIGKWHLYGNFGVAGLQSQAQSNRTRIPPQHRRGFTHWRGFELSNAFYDTWYFADDEAEPRRIEGYQTDGLFALAAEYLDGRRPGDRPFFAIVSVEPPHPPFVAPGEHDRRVRERGELQLPPNADWTGARGFTPGWQNAQNAGGDAGIDDAAARTRLFRENLYTYYAMIENIDDNMGALLRRLETTGLAQDTVVLFLSDHGELGGAHGLVGKNQPYEESIGIPLLAFSANPALLPGGRRIDAPVASEDLFPTLCGLAGLPPDPAKPGLDLSPLLRGEAAGIDREAILLEHVAELRPQRDFHTEAWRGIRTARHKYTVRGDAAGGRPWQLFDLAADPYEMTNLLEEAGSRPLAATLHAALRRLILSSEDHFPLAPALDSDGLNLPQA